MMYQNLAPDTLIEHPEMILDFNRMMEEKAAVHKLNEKALLHLLNLLDEAAFVQSNLYWLSLARINELAIMCAGNCAENCEFALVGDLLINPRLILIHVRGRHHPIIKKRHTPLTEQFSHMAVSREGVIDWLKKQTIVETRQQALLPHLLDRMKNSEIFHPSHVISIENRLKRVADLTGYLACQRFENHSSVAKWLRKASPMDRNMVESRFCRFNFKRFYRMGEDIKRLANDSTYESRFLKKTINGSKRN
ncbi:MAG: hypothetical protein LJE96_03595 [Deltaproteobacteria bacterium]|nr:hypothetical protein [Deltaproteobacteria bacterium]